MRNMCNPTGLECKYAQQKKFRSKNVAVRHPIEPDLEPTLWPYAIMLARLYLMRNVRGKPLVRAWRMASSLQVELLLGGRRPMLAVGSFSSSDVRELVSP